MNRPDIEKLLGGYATGSLSPEEEQTLFAAALEDQDLFDALMAEQPLRDLLREPTARARLLAALADRPAPWYRRFSRPLIAVAALLLIAAPVAIWRVSRRPPPAVLTAQMDTSPKGLPRVELRAVPPPPTTSLPAEPRRAAPPARRQRAAEPATEPIAAPKLDAAKPAAPQLGGITGPSKDTGADTLVINGAPAQLKAGSTAETVEVSAENNQIQVQPVAPVNGFLPAPQTSRVKASPVLALPERPLPVNTTVLRRNQEGAFVAADPNDLHAGETVKLRLESANTGFVYISEQQKLLAESSIEAGKPFETIVEPTGAGRRQLQIRFSPRQVIWNTAAAAGSGGGVGGAVFNGKPATDGPLLPFPAITLTLQYK
jgi:hypothetical protein